MNDTLSDTMDTLRETISEASRTATKHGCRLTISEVDDQTSISIIPTVKGEPIYNCLVGHVTPLSACRF